ncbi:MAG TPA: diacylglycerol kinase family protein [Patescibacteria group bacterium]|nr:diacylglycerol kinase family protein [Patescibacteria group bacterium]
MPTSSYLYLIDPLLAADRRNEEMLIELEKTAVELGIQGPWIRLSPIKTIQDALSTRKNDNVQTIVGIGGDGFFSELLDYVCDQPRTLGFIPLGDESRFAKILGLPAGRSAAGTIAQRLVANIDCGKINQRYFFSSAFIPPAYSVFINRQFRLYCEPAMFFRVTNIETENPKRFTGHLTLQILQPSKGLWIAKQEECGRFFVTDIRVEGTGAETIIADEKKTFKPPVEIRIAPKALRVIVGKNRNHFLGE